MIVATPSSVASPDGAPSPAALIVRECTMIDRARMFAHSEHEKLFTVLDGNENFQFLRVKLSR